jgi:hypothetical protein
MRFGIIDFNGFIIKRRRSLKVTTKMIMEPRKKLDFEWAATM